MQLPARFETKEGKLVLIVDLPKDQRATLIDEVVLNPQARYNFPTTYRKVD